MTRTDCNTFPRMPRTRNESGTAATRALHRPVARVSPRGAVRWSDPPLAQQVAVPRLRDRAYARLDIWLSRAIAWAARFHPVQWFRARRRGRLASAILWITYAAEILAAGALVYFFLVMWNGATA